MIKQIAKSVDKIIAVLNPIAGQRRLRARLLMNMAGGYSGASKSERSLKEWKTLTADANADILPDLETLRNRSQNLVNNNPIAAGIIKTEVTSVVGTGLKLESRVDRNVLKITDEQADELQDTIEREWGLFWNSKSCGSNMSLTGKEILNIVYKQVMIKGDCFILLPKIKRRNKPYDISLQVVEADRVCNPNWSADTTTLAGGIETDKYGAPVKYHFLKTHPGSMATNKDYAWEAIPAFGDELGLRNVIHAMEVDRPGQSRGVPSLAPVIEELKQISRATKNELMATTISSMFTVFLESEEGFQDNGINADLLNGETGGSSADDDVKLGNGLIVELPAGKKVHDSNPGRPNINFDPFFQAIVKQIGAGVGIPAEIIMKVFNKSHSASKAALLEAWRHFLAKRGFIVDNFLRIVYEIWMWEAVAKGRIAAPGFFSDPSTRAAYLASDWVGPARGQLDELKEVLAAEKRVENGFSNRSIEAAELGRDWEKLHAQAVKEYNARLTGGLIKKEVAADGE